MKPATDARMCQVCHGSGIYRLYGFDTRGQVRAGLGGPCHACGGTGHLNPEPQTIPAELLEPAPEVAQDRRSH